MYISLLGLLAKYLFLISLTPDMSSIWGQYIKWIFGTRKWTIGACSIHSMQQPGIAALSEMVQTPFTRES